MKDKPMSAQPTGDRLQPRDAADLQEAVETAVAEGQTLEVIGRGSKRAIGRAAQWNTTLDLSGLSGVTLYEPAELVLSAKAGTPIAEIEALVAAHRQQLAFEPIDYGPILGVEPGGGTLGGVLAANLSGPRRVKAGAARDHFLGFSGVSGRGEVFKSGGRVVKNVTGYDLCKLMAGSWGTLAALTDVTIKVLPRPETEVTLVVAGLDDTAGVRLLTLASGSTGEISGAAHLPADAAARGAGRGAMTALRLEGVPPSIAHRRIALESMLGVFGELIVLEEPASREFWRAVRDVTPFAAAAVGTESPLWRISTAPTQGPVVAARIAAATDAQFIFDWGGGLVWALLRPSEDAGAALVRPAVVACGGHATLVRAPAAVRAAVAVFEPPNALLAAVNRRVKDGFDPAGVLNPGRMYAGA